ncbi:MAG: hypothetical protein LUE99_00520 [Bacteroides sp.]|nr:hypothetical protein [Bacteroides sp.]
MESYITKHYFDNKLLSLAIGMLSYYDFKFILKGTPELAFTITEIKDINYEHLTFLTTYIIPLVCFDFENIRYQIVLFILLIVTGIIYVKTNLFYANPTLAILKFRIYKVSGAFINGDTRKNIIIIIREKVAKDDRVKYIILDNRIYYAKKNQHISKDELIQSINFLFQNNIEKQIIIYALLENNAYPQKLDIKNENLPELIQVFSNGINKRIVEKEYTIVSLSTADERGNCYYEYDLDELPAEIEFLSTVVGNDSLQVFDFRTSKINQIKSLIIVISSGDSIITLFKKLTPVEK